MRLIKTSLIIIWFLLLGLLLHRDFFVRTLDTREVMALERDRRVEYQSIYFKDEKIGYVENQFLPQDDQTLRIKQQARMQLMISGQNHPVELDLDALLGSQSDLISFEFSFNSPFYRMRADGRVDGETVSFELDTGNNVVKDRVVLDGPPRLSTSRRAYLLSQDIEEGEKLKIPWFDPFSLTGKESVIEYRGREKVLINDRVYNLHRFTENFGGARLNSWLDDDGLVIKEESPAGFVFIKEPEFKAKSMATSEEGLSDLLASVAVEVTGEMFDLASKTEARYRISLPEEIEFALSSGRQSFNDQILTVVKEDLSSLGSEPGTCSAAHEQLLASPYIQAGAPEIIEQSLALTRDQTGDLGKVKALAEWVYTNLEKRPVIGIPDALSTLKTGIGDCNEHASLFAALSRAAGIPTTIAVGVVYHKQAFYYHAWNEVCVGGQWISLDTTTNQLPADLSHLKFIEGELQEQIKIGALINNLQIEPLHQ
ncbi:MAG: transglutaminase-like domain-containing protein [Desulfocapsaceae bacterium]